MAKASATHDQINICRVPGCKKPAHVRGLCVSDYSALYRRVKRGETTWAALEKAGAALPGRSGRRGAITSLVRSLEQKGVIRPRPANAK